MQHFRIAVTDAVVESVRQRHWLLCLIHKEYKMCVRRSFGVRVLSQRERLALQMNAVLNYLAKPCCILCSIVCSRDMRIYFVYSWLHAWLHWISIFSMPSYALSYNLCNQWQAGMLKNWTPCGHLLCHTCLPMVEKPRKLQKAHKELCATHSTRLSG